jgi:hypothetical protein
MSHQKKVFYKDKHLIDKAWDLFSDYIGENNIQTPISYDEFERIFNILNKDNVFTEHKEDILYSFRYDSYSWPLVERE